MLRVTRAEHLEDFKIRVLFSNGEAGVVDLFGALWGPVFEPLKDPSRFREFTVSEVLHTIAWENGADFAPEFLYDRMVEQSAAHGRADARR
ncbi:MAG TPA: DUF2442 domain-containing protein [Candidatus Methylomirabilis sp.]|nr:DUF2442 domain-containing protein [Candidatus Methylomirabilis sp.]HSB78600.1 DUF2442 domain-containing protein [Candidatus Methylomirabilis sp.]